MKASRNPLIIATHLLVLGLAFGIARNVKPVMETVDREIPSRTRSSNRSLEASSSDGPELLAEFRKEISVNKSRYKELKKVLPPSVDPKGAALMAIEEWKKDSSEQDRIEVFAMMQVRFLQWLRAYPHEAMDYLVVPTGGEGAIRQAELNAVLGLNVLPDAVREKGLLNSLDWLTLHPAGMTPFWTVLIEEMSQGGGLALFLRVETALGETSKRWMEIGIATPSDELIRKAGASVRFGEKEKLLEYVKLQDNQARGASLLLGFVSSSEAAAEWAMELLERGELPKTIASRIKGGIGNGVLKLPGLDIEERIAARRFTPGNERKSRDAILSELVSNDVNRLLNEGRDWRFEFRHGKASLDEILSNVNGTLSLNEEARTVAHIALYRTLSEENPVKAQALLDILPEDRRREVMFSNTWQSYGNIDPGDFLAYLKQLPEPVTESEKQDRMKGWDWKVRGFLQRYGDDYIEWVAALPPNPDKYAAINSVIWATREQNPVKAAELNQRFYPKKP